MSWFGRQGEAPAAMLRSHDLETPPKKRYNTLDNLNIRFQVLNMCIMLDYGVGAE